MTVNYGMGNIDWYGGGNNRKKRKDGRQKGRLIGDNCELPIRLDQQTIISLYFLCGDGSIQPFSTQWSICLFNEQFEFQIRIWQSYYSNVGQHFNLYVLVTNTNSKKLYSSVYGITEIRRLLLLCRWILDPQFNIMLPLIGINRVNWSQDLIWPQTWTQFKDLCSYSWFMCVDVFYV